MLRGLGDATRDTAHAISWTTTDKGSTTGHGLAAGYQKGGEEAGGLAG